MIREHDGRHEQTIGHLSECHVSIRTAHARAVFSKLRGMFSGLEELARNAGVEPATFGFVDRRSIQLS
jgi:hypothetical protein